MTMTPEAKKALSAAIRGLREHLLDGLHSETEQTYLLSIDAAKAGLDEVARERRARLEGWIDEQVRALPEKQVVKDSDRAAAKQRFRRDAEKQAAYTLLGRVIMLRLLEAAGLHKPAIVTGAWESRGFKVLRELAPGLVRGDRSEGYAYLLQLVFEDLGTELPGLYGHAGVGELIPIPVDTWRHVVETLDDPALASCWTDDMTLGWVYQYWNDPEREALDVKLHARGKLEPHEIASKTQMFTERYMVDWLLQNSLGPMWLAICAKNKWTAEAQADGILAALESRRVEWRAKREAGEVALTELMPLNTAAEHRWAYYVPQDLPADAATHAPASIRDLKLLDPAVGSGHFLVVAFDLLFALYQEEARHCREVGQPQWSDRAIVERILEKNLHGLDLDPRAIQIAAAALWLKARQTCPDARPRRLNLVAANLRLAGLKNDDPALVELRRAVARETAIPEKLTDTIVDALRGADHLGSLLRIDHAVEAAIDACEEGLSRPVGGIQGVQGELLAGTFPQEQRLLLGREEAKTTLLDRLEEFLKEHTSGDDLGLRLRGQQLATGVRFVRMLREGSYHLLVGNPPYQDTSKMADAAYVQEHYKEGRADLYAAFLQRGLQLVRPGGVSAMLTMRNWMFIKQYVALRRELLKDHDLRALGDFAIGAFDEVPNDVLSVVVSVFHCVPPRADASVGLQPTPPDDRSYDRERTKRKRAATLAGIGRITYSPQALQAVPEQPLVYWWTREFVERYSTAQKVGELCAARFGVNTGNNTRFIRRIWEVEGTLLVRLDEALRADEVSRATWAPYLKGGGDQWAQPAVDAIDWTKHGLELKVSVDYNFGNVAWKIPNESYYFGEGVAFAKIGADFSGRAHRYRSIIDSAGSSVYPPEIATMLCVLNSATSRFILQSLNPTVNFQVGDVNRLPIFPIASADKIFASVERAFDEHESHREPSVEFRRPGPSPWRHAQAWAQLAVDRPEGAPLPEYLPEHDPEPASDHLSNALGVALGRFGACGEGILDPAKDDLGHALPAGILFLDNTLTTHDHNDSLGHPAAAPLHAAWQQYGPAIAPGDDLRGYLSAGFFDLQRKMYENRPIHWPLSSEKRTFVAWVTIHRWTANTLRTLLADHLVPRLTRLEGELADLRAARDGGDKKTARAADKRFAQVQKSREELAAFIAAVEQCAEKGPPPEGPKCPPRAVDARYFPDLDDGVMINSAALWPLLAPQWKDPRKWWRELSTADDKKDYDWSHLAMRYWPDRVDAKCNQDPSLAVAHGCFWKYHPARAWAWELRLQDELAPDFRITEAPYRGDGSDAAHRAHFLATRGAEAIGLLQTELLRRLRKHKRPLADYTLQYTGLWSAHPEACWNLEQAVMLKQQAPFVLHADDEAAARAAFYTEHSRARGEREKLLETFAQGDIFEKPAGDEPDDPDAPDDETSEDEEDA
jgi:hypothetical protein